MRQYAPNPVRLKSTAHPVRRKGQIPDLHPAVCSTKMCPGRKGCAMNIDLKGRKAVVTGSTAGIGRAIAEGLARAGATVVINGRGEARVEAALREMRAAMPEARIEGG